MIRVNSHFWEMVGTFRTIVGSITLFDRNKEYLQEKQIDHFKTFIKVQGAERFKDAMKNLRQSIKHQFESAYTKFQTYSTIAFAYNATEYYLKQLCKELKNRESLHLGIRDISGQPFTKKFSKFMKNSKLIDLPKSDKNLINKLQILRNCIVHRYGRIEDADNETELVRIIKDEDGIDMDKNGDLRVSINKAVMLTELASQAVANVFKANNFGEGFEVEGT